MRNKIGTLFIVLGAVFLIGALSLFICNRWEEAEAESAVSQLMPRIVDQIGMRQESGTVHLDTAQLEIPRELLTPEDLEMTEVEIDGYFYIGYLSIPSLELELPVMAGWDYNRLRIAPCRYTGTVGGEDLVIMAHNYSHHFGRIKELKEGDSVVFVDMDGIVTDYEVLALDVLAPTAVEEMTSGEFDLTLFTCTYGGKSRVTVYCGKAE